MGAKIATGKNLNGDEAGGVNMLEAAGPPVGRVGIVAKAGGGLWKLTQERASAVKNHSIFGTFYKSKSDGLWWAVDRAGHGGSKFKVFEETSQGLQWYRDADEFGNFIINKHKGNTGTFIPWGKLKTAR